MARNFTGYARFAKACVQGNRTLIRQTIGMLIRIFIALALMVSTIVPAPAAEQSLGAALKKVFSTPTPTPRPRKKKSAVATKKKSPTPTPTPKKSSTPREEESPAPSATSSPKKKPTPSATEELPSPTPTPKKHGAPNATLLPDQLKGFDNYPAKVQKLLTNALELTARNLDYKYGSADPATGGMDCSGFVYFVLKQNGVEDAPRDSSEQYSWVRRARQFESVLSQKDDTFELEDLKPGDLLFWTGTYSIERDPPITHAMIYLGREKKTGHRVMVGASDGRVYQGEPRYGVSVFDFKVQRNGKADDGKLRPTFIGYGHIPGLQEPRQP